jgi:hypothetical protein
VKSETQRLWYVRLAEQVRGPFPTAAIVQDLALGRLPADVQLSSDRMTWATAADLEAFAGLLDADSSDAWAEERRQALRRWADERAGAGEPAKGANSTEAERRRRDHGSQRAKARLEPQGVERRTWLVFAGLAALIVTLVTLVWWLGAGSAPAIKLLK